jgi:hypothetical protein
MTFIHSFVSTAILTKCKPYVLQGIPAFTAFVKVNIKFPMFDAVRDNVNGSELTKGYNLWTIDEMLKAADTNYDDIKESGAVILMR